MMKNLFTFLLATSASFVYAFPQVQEVYVSDAGNFENPPWQILKFDSNGENPSVFIDTNLDWPQDILFLEASNEVLVSNLGSGCIAKYEANTGAYISDFACLISGPTRIKIGPDGLLYVLQWNGNGKVRQYDLDGTDLGEFSSVGVPQSIGMDWDSDNNLYVSSYNGDLVRKFDSSGNDLGIFIETNLVGPTNIWFDDEGDLLVSDYDGGAIKRFDSDGNFQENFIDGLSKSEGVAYLSNGNILIGNGGTSAVKMYENDGTYLEDFITTGAGSLLTPNAVVLRELEQTSVDEQDTLIDNIVSPSTGTAFKIDAKKIEAIEDFVIHDSLGKQVEDIVHIDGTIYLNHVAEGVYFINFNFSEGKVLTQKVIVKK